MGEYELPIGAASELAPKSREKGLAEAALIQNARWFVRLRWIVSAVLAIGGGATAVFPGFFVRLGLDFPFVWLWILGAVLAACNMPFALLARSYSEKTTIGRVRLNIWLQIAVDLIVISMLVYILDGVANFVPFTYLFHIALACIFFPPRESIIVTLSAGGLYLSTVVLEATGLLPKTWIFFASGMTTGSATLHAFFVAVSAVFIWIGVWYLVSTLSSAVRMRDQRLSIANDRLQQANQEKNQQMLITTHDLKAPFVGIESNVQVLKYQFWESIPDAVREIVEKIDRRAHILRNRIDAILLLGDLKSQAAAKVDYTEIVLGDLLEEVVEGLQERALERNVKLSVDAPDVSVSGARDQLATLFSNLIANAISYSYEGGSVEIYGETIEDYVRIAVRDHGIGIREDAVNHIFDEYFRTKEATKFNRQSTGLGLAIVKVIAQAHNLKVHVTSEEGKGTTFSALIPSTKSTIFKKRR